MQLLECHMTQIPVISKWSEKQDSNLRHPRPKRGALARLSYTPKDNAYNRRIPMPLLGQPHVRL